MNRKKRILLSVVIGLLLTVLSIPILGNTPMNSAWWGTLYPKYCYAQLPEQSLQEQAQVKIRFRWLHGF